MPQSPQAVPPAEQFIPARGSSTSSQLNTAEQELTQTYPYDTNFASGTLAKSAPTWLMPWQTGNRQQGRFKAGDGNLQDNSKVHDLPVPGFEHIVVLQLA